MATCQLLTCLIVYEHYFSPFSQMCPNTHVWDNISYTMMTMTICKNITHIDENINDLNKCDITLRPFSLSVLREETTCQLIQKKECYSGRIEWLNALCLILASIVSVIVVAKFIYPLIFS